jgi:integrase
MVHSTVSGARRKPALRPVVRPQKNEFPLYQHGIGYWAKKINGQTKYFGKVADDPNGVAALERWLAEKDDLLAGRVPRNRDDQLLLGELANEYLAAKKEERDGGELSARTFLSYYATCKSVCEALGRHRSVADLSPEDFRQLRKALARGRKTKGTERSKVSLKNEIIRARGLFKFGFTEGLLDAPVRFGSAFKMPKPKFLRRERKLHRREHGLRMLTAEQIRTMLDNASMPLKAMILLGINAGLGQTDLSELPLSAVDLKGGWLNYERPKTEVDRRCPLWPETLAAIRQWLPQRPKAKHRADSGLLFLTVRGARFVKLTKERKKGTNGKADEGTPGGAGCDAIGQEFKKLLFRLGIKKQGDRRSFYGFRHGFQTVGEGCGDPVAVRSIMGHVDSTMSANYREEVSDTRLQTVTNHIHSWLFGPPT